MDGLVGLDRVKKQFNTLISRAEVDAQRRELGMKLPERDMHLVFAGPPGTGKSTSARILAKAYSAVGLVKNPVPVEVSGRELVSKYAGETAEQTREIFDRAKNGVLFIDEAYAMVTGPHDTHGIEALNEFLKLAEDRRDSTVVILAGYGDEDEQQGVVEYLAQYNPGLRSRFPQQVKFDPYTPKELNEVGTRMLSAQEFTLADDKAGKAFKAATKAVGLGDANARGVRTLVSAVSDAQADRLARQARKRKPTREELSTITSEDIADGLSRLSG